MSSFFYISPVNQTTMKNIFSIALIASVLFIAGCSKEKNSNCRVPVFTVNEYGSGAAYVQMEDNGSYGFFEVEYGSNGFAKGSGTTKSIASSGLIENLNNGTYDIYVRGNCGGTDFSDWTPVKSFIITGGGSSSCPKPTSLYAESYSGNTYRLYWSSYSSAGYYQVEYDETGFTKGTGTLMNSSNSNYLVTLTPGLTYDYYVRANCGGSDFSTWAGPYSFYVEY